MITIIIGTERKLFTPNPTRDRIMNVAKNFEQYHAVVFTLAKDGFQKQVIDNAIVYPTNSQSKIWYVWDAIRIGLRITRGLSLGERKKTVISVQDPFECGIVGLVIAKFYAIALHVQIHVDLYSPYFKNTSLQHIRSVIAPWVIRRADSIRCDSVRMKTGIETRGLSHAPIQVLPIFIDTAKYQSSQPLASDIHDLFSEKRFVVLIASRLEPEKDISLAISAFASVTEKYPGRAGLVIVGSGSCEGALLAQVKTLHLEDDVRFIPWTNDLYSLYTTADLFAITSRFEGYGLTIAEALLCGTPVISTDVGVAPEIVIPGKTGWVCPPRNQKCLENVLISILKEPDAYDQVKKYLIAHPYQHAYANRQEYDRLLVANMADALARHSI